ncbi:MAG: glucose 1-dehydrogenase [Alphaproteobacteria bacterium]|nr:MAG: glucose 1-dehydrogenase [Alphaproteobacteria bacterium]
MERLAGKTAVVTGAAQGIGAAFAQGLAREGAKVAIWDVDRSDGVADQIRERHGQALAVLADVADEASVEAAIAATIAAFGGIDILVNNAALFTQVQRKPVTQISVAEWDRVSAVNIRGPFLCCKHAIPHMRKAGAGKIINISSGRALKGKGFFLHYDASKAAILGMTRSLARELGDDKICVNTIAPGSTMSENVLKRQNWMGGGPEQAVQSRALKRLEVPEDLVGACIFLASSESDFITGQTLVVDGGSAMV